MNQLKKEYRPPSLTKYGSVEQITAGNSYGNYFDNDFSSGDSVDDATFSLTS